MSELYTVLSVSQMTTILEVTPQMAGRYYRAFEKLTGKPLPVNGRNGRTFTPEVEEVLRAARETMRVESHETVEGAVKRALEASGWLGIELAQYDPPTDLTAFKEALREEIAAPLIEEIQALRREVAELRRTAIEAPRNETGLERMNGYLLGELERRRKDAEAEEKQRPWWRLWGRS